jgi:phosphoesterase RecJ-like protein
MDLLKELEGAKRIGITGHVRPDGDCVGSCLALLHYLEICMPETETEVFLEDPGRSFANIKKRDCLICDFPDRDPFDVFVVCDTTGSKDRTGEAFKYFESAVKTINIDHHISNKDGSAMVNHVCPKVSSCAEVLYDLMDESKVDAVIAELIYMGMAHDTGVFRFSNTSQRTMEIAGKLITYGFDFPMLLDETFYVKTYVQSRFQAQVLLNARRYLEDRVIVGTADRMFMDAMGAGKDDTDGAVNELRNIHGIECAVFIYEKTPGLYKASLRVSSDKVNVAKVAESLGGGGHVRAAGCDYRGAMEDMVYILLTEIAKQL